jgi:hypothetical protein
MTRRDEVGGRQRIVTVRGLNETMTPRTLRDGRGLRTAAAFPGLRRFDVAFAPRPWRVPATTGPALGCLVRVRGVGRPVVRERGVAAACAADRCCGDCDAELPSTTCSRVKPGGGVAVIRPIEKPASRRMDATRTRPRALDRRRRRLRGWGSTSGRREGSGIGASRDAVKTDGSSAARNRAARNSPGSGSSALAFSASAGSMSASSGLMTGTRCVMISTQLFCFGTPSR